MTNIRETLLLEVHRAIETAAKEAVAKLGRPLRYASAVDSESPIGRSVQIARTSLVAYPPMDATGGQLTTQETDALATMALSPEARSGLEKLVADAAAAAFFRFFCLLDAVGDPEVQPVEDWYGAVLAPTLDDEDRPMFHDELFDSYWRYREISQPTP